MTAIERLRAVLAAATPGPWEADLGLVGPPPRHGVPWMHIAECPRAANAAAIAALGSLWPALLAVVEAADRLRATRLGSFEHGYAVGHLLSEIDALDAAIAAALPEAP